MFQWIRQRRMMGGLVFGPAAWMPGRIENTFAPPALPGGADEEMPRVDPAPPPNRKLELPMERREAATFLEDIGIRRTSGIIPAIADQLRGLRDDGGAGVAGMGGGGRGQQHAGSRVRAMVLNLLPTQPEFALADALTRLAVEDVRAGLVELQRVVRARRVMIVIDKHAHGTIEAWKKFAKADGFEIVTLLNRYPQAHPTILLRTLFAKRLAPDMLPSRLHRVVVDPVACWGVGRWLRTGHAMSERPVQLFVTGSESAARGGGDGARLVMGRLGETVAGFCERFGITLAGRQVILNGMLAGIDIDPATTRIESGTESVSVRQSVAPEGSSACLACGWCVDVCPTGLNPVGLLELAQRVHSKAPTPVDEPESRPSALLRSSAARESVHCIGCGLCSFVCPTRLPLTQEAVRLRLHVIVAELSSRGVEEHPR